MDRDKNIDLSAAELARLRLEDGLSVDGDVELVDDAATVSDLALRAQLSVVLSAVNVPPIADHVMRRIGGLREPIFESVEHEAATPQIASGVMSRIGVDQGAHGLVKKAILEDAGPAPELWGRLASSVGANPVGEFDGLLKRAITGEAETQFRPTTLFGMQRPWWKIGAIAGAALAAAAAVLFYLSFVPDSAPSMEASIGAGELGSSE